MAKLISDSRDIRKALAENPNVLVLVLPPHIRKEDLVGALTPFLQPEQSSASAPTPPHKRRRDDYEKFLTTRGYADNALHAAIFDKMSVCTEQSDFSCPFPRIFTGAGKGELWVTSAVDLALLTRDEVRRRLEVQQRARRDRPTKRAQERCQELERWFQSTFRIGFLD